MTNHATAPTLTPPLARYLLLFPRRTFFSEDLGWIQETTKGFLCIYQTVPRVLYTTPYHTIYHGNGNVVVVLIVYPHVLSRAFRQNPGISGTKINQAYSIFRHPSSPHRPSQSPKPSTTAKSSSLTSNLSRRSTSEAEALAACKLSFTRFLAPFSLPPSGRDFVSRL